MVNWGHHFLLDHEDPALFCTSQWQRGDVKTKPSCLYLVYRISMFVFVCVSLVSYLITLPYPIKFFPIYLTHWGYLFIVFFEAFDTLLLLLEFCREKPFASVGPLQRCCWLLSNIAFTAAPVVSIFFWSAVYNYGDDIMPGERDMLFSFCNFLVHVVNSIIAVVEVLITARPWRWHHFYQPVILGIVYMIFSIIYDARGGTGREGQEWIYEVLDWNEETGQAIGVTIGSVLATCVVHLFMYSLHLLRLVLAGRWEEKRNEKEGKEAEESGRVSNAW